ncbi:hypothetical protein G9A89_022805 [Geosiphon pyriformis]|nr:hypothetical protein G9A89_022805 [Geosiphon pyriformis]
MSSTKPGPKILGQLVIVVLKARNLPNREIIGKADPFATIRIGSNAKRTRTDKRGGQHPEWDEEIRFQLLDEPSNKKMKIQVYNEDKREHDLIGETVVELDEVLKKGEWDDWFLLKFRNKDAGEIFLEMTFYLAGVAPPGEKSQELRHPLKPLPVTPHPPINTSPSIKQNLPTSSPASYRPPINYPQNGAPAASYPTNSPAYPHSVPAASTYQQHNNSGYPPRNNSVYQPPNNVYLPQNNVYPPPNNGAYPPSSTSPNSGTLYYSPTPQNRPLPQHQPTSPYPPISTGYHSPIPGVGSNGISPYPPPVTSPSIQSSPLSISATLPPPQYINSSPPPPISNGVVPLSFPIPVPTPPLTENVYPNAGYPPNNQFAYPPNNTASNFYPNPQQQQSYPQNFYPPPAQGAPQQYPSSNFGGQVYPPA